MPQGSLCLANNGQQDPSVPSAVPVVPGALTNGISGSGSCQGAAGKWRKGGLWCGIQTQALCIWPALGPSVSTLRSASVGDLWTWQGHGATRGASETSRCSAWEVCGLGAGLC